MSGLVPISLEKCLEILGSSPADGGCFINAHWRLSIAYWLKDARRYNFIKDNKVNFSAEATPQEVDMLIDSLMGK